MASLKLGFIGAGFISRFQATGLRSVRGLDLAGVYSVEGAEEFAAFARGSGVGECSPLLRL